MNLPSENSDGNDGVVDFPVRKLTRESRKKDVSRLEFHAVGQQGTVMTDVEAGLFQVEAEAQLKKEAAALDEQLQSQAEEIAVQIEAAQKETRIAVREEWKSELCERVMAERTMIKQTCEQFSKDRAKYFADVEAEVVKLALAISARVLHREAQLEPLLLTAVVRVALEKIAEESGAVLRVPAEEAERWCRVFETDIDVSVKLVGDERLSAGECILETRVGTVALGVSAQLAEIERGFFDLLQQRPT